jgi:homoserine O-succinyltransferase
MPDAALEATERQFVSLLESASEGFSIRLSLYSLPEVPRSEAGARRVRELYSSVETLWDKQLDALIVTGREPLTPNLANEPYWDSFTRVVDWAQDNTYAAVWSCLAAHAAVLYMDGISRVKSGSKYCGIFDCERVSDHPLLANAPARFKLPHSRWNGVPEDELTASGYRILTRTASAGVDTFAKQCKSLFVFFQGHPEYEPSSLLLEYRRDVGRYFRGETDIYPPMPRNYFDKDTASALTALRQECMDRRREEVMAEVAWILEKLNVKNGWHSTATCIYKNLLQFIYTQKKLELNDNIAAAEGRASDRSTPFLLIAKELSRPGVQATSLDQERPRLLRATR